MNMSEHVFVEAGGTLTPSTNSNGHFNTLGISIGYRF
jgi:hypothetical protein